MVTTRAAKKRKAIPSAEPSFDLHGALEEKLRGFVSDVNDRNILRHTEKLRSVTYLLQNFCPEIRLSESFIHENQRVTLEDFEPGDRTAIQLKGKAQENGKLRLDITGQLKLQSIPAKDIEKEEPKRILMLPRVHEVRPQSSISELIPRFFDDEDEDATTSLFYDLAVCTGNDGVKFVIHRHEVLEDDSVEDDSVEDDSIEEEEVNLRAKALADADQIAEVLDCVVHYGIEVTLLDNRQFGLTLSIQSKDEKDASNTTPLAQMMHKIAAMENVSALKFISPANKLQSEEMPFNVEALEDVLMSGKRLAFERVSLKSKLLKAARGEIEFQSCYFSDSEFYERLVYESEQDPLRVVFSELRDSCFLDPVEFLTSIIHGVEQGKIIQVTFRGWECLRTDSDSIITKLAELSRKLPGGFLVLKDLSFYKPNELRTLNIRNAIETKNTALLLENNQEEST